MPSKRAHFSCRTSEEFYKSFLIVIKDKGYQKKAEWLRERMREEVHGSTTTSR